MWCLIFLFNIAVLMTDNEISESENERRKNLPPVAIRALKEADQRRRAAVENQLPTEIDGPKGEEPTRYGDWERKGRAVDF